MATLAGETVLGERAIGGRRWRGWTEVQVQSLPRCSSGSAPAATCSTSEEETRRPEMTSLGHWTVWLSTMRFASAYLAATLRPAARL